jgi:beta-glucosidase
MAENIKYLASPDDILSRLSLEEKARFVIGDSPFRTKYLERLGVPPLVVMDGGTGFNSIQDEQEKAFRAYCKRRSLAGIPVSEDEFVSGDECLDTGRMSDLAGGAVKAPDLGEMLASRPQMAVGCYPPGMFIGATWNPDVIERCGRALGREANALGIDILLGTPNVNIHRDPLGGRIFEGYSEDPVLVSRLAPAFVRGIQDCGVIANVKHYAANNQEKGRRGIDEYISERALREIYLSGFKACVEAGCRTVMSVGYIDVFDIVKRIFDRLHISCIGYLPNSVNYTVVSRDVIERFAFHYLCSHRIDSFIVTISEKNRPCLSTESIDVADPVNLLVCSRILVFFDHT